MTSVNSSAPPAEPLTEVPADPPTIKNAGRLNTGYGMDLAAIMMLVAMFAILVGSMVLAIWTSHGRRGEGLVAYAISGVAAAMIALFAFALQDDWYSFPEALLIVGAPLAVGWAVLGGIAFFVGSVVRPGKRPNLAAF